MNLQISYNWLKEFIKTEKSVKDFVVELSLKSQTVERTTPIKPKFKKVITAKILEISKHPNADKLQLATVDTGQTKITVVCGAPNIAVGQIVAYAQIGASVIDSHAETETTFVIAKASIRGQESAGMLCSPKELGLGDSHMGILVLAPKTPLGKPLEDVLALDDTLFDIEITSNRPDAMSVIGLAREAAAATGGKFIWSESKVNYKTSSPLPLSVAVDDKKLCPRYQAVVLSNVTVGPSPMWLQLRLMQAGRRPINNIVDITNYVALEYGQPTHVFDYDKLQGKKIIVRNAKAGESILALDGNTYKLSTSNLVIADAKNPIAVAGVMGGEKSSATPSSTNIVFEVANFDSVQIRKTARALNLHSESSSLFEKGLHPEGTSIALARCIELAQQLAGATLASEALDIHGTHYQPGVIGLSLANITRYLGVEISADQVIKILTSLGFEVAKKDSSMNVSVPWWRANDITAEHDLIEEIARMYGYANIPNRLPSGEMPMSFQDPALVWESKIKHALAGLGFTELYNYSMVSKEVLKISKTGLDQAIKIDNPLNEDMEYLRVDLAPQILKNISDNINHFSQQKIFELSNIYLPQSTSKLPLEQAQLCGAVVSDQDAFLKVKGAVQSALKPLGIFLGDDLPLADEGYLWEKSKALEIKKGSKALGQFGLVKRSLLDKFGIETPVALFSLNFSEIIKLASQTRRYQPIPAFPQIVRDVAIVVDDKLNWSEIVAAVAKADSLIAKVSYLSTFVDVKLGKAKKSLAFRLTLQAKDRTLKSEEADVVVRKVVEKLKKSFTIEIR